MTKLKVGTYLPNFAWNPDDGVDHAERLRNWIVEAENHGFDSIWVTDHLLRARDMYSYTWLEPLTTLAMVAGLTDRVRFGPGVLLLPLRHPVMLAKMAVTLQQLSKGRFVLGVGTGWFPREFEALGTTKSERGRRTDEVLELVRSLASGEAVTHRGTFFTLDDVHIEPSPVRVPVWVGGGSQVAHADSVEKPVMSPKVAARIVGADGWFSRPSAQPNQVAQDWRLLQPFFEDAGVDSSGVVIAHGQWLHLTDHGRRADALEEQHRAAEVILGTGRSRQHLEQSYLFGTFDEVVDQCRLRAEIGIDELILHPYTDDPRQIEAWGKELLPVLKDMEVGPRPT
jgi:probable F420-dependent oxidoreductase